MINNTKLLVTFIIAIIALGSAVLFSLNQVDPHTENPPSTSSAVSVGGEKAVVTKVIDGDTIKVNIDGKEVTIRILGVDTPETVDPRKSVECFGKESSRELKDLLEGKRVILQKDISNTDKYHRLLRYVYLPLPDGKLLFVNDYLIREGFAKVLTIPPDVKFIEQFLEAQRKAREALRGLWGRC